ncbi:MAG TPA: bifunctional serine/threonine-protein kinase/formylglycine-generating enzyme family protein [Vicinamibacteria bacterium]|nr:bifunctional serine/threonine-protein kinase/formylglycine-generating enzyme family protein [Vicinamibacteria bacterium]
MALRENSHFGPYLITGTLGKGGMASVYRAYETDLDRYVALKVLPAGFLHDDSFSERFRREAKVIARLEHPHIVPIHAFGIDEGVPWMAMRLIAGGTVASLLRQGPIERSRAVRILEDVASALDYAHLKGIVHRDVKPPNILLDEEDRAYLADFGVARITEGSTFLTQTGVLAGTPQYMAPEQAQSGAATNRCDIYALSVVAYEMLTGRVPFTGDTPVAVLMRHVQDPVPVPTGLPEPLAGALLRGLAKRPEDRWPSARALVEGLKGGAGATAPAAPPPESPRPEATVTSEPRVPPAPKPRLSPRALWGGGAVVGAVALALLLARERREAPAAEPPRFVPAATVSSAPPAVAPTPKIAPSPTEAAPPPEPRAGEVRPNPKDGLEYVWIPPPNGFAMGCVSTDRDCYADEKPAHKVRLSHGYWLGRTEVPVGAYKRFSTAAGRPLPTAPPFNAGWANDEQPIVYMTWADGTAFCEWAGGRLPTEAEWEYAARGGLAGARYPWGNQSPVCREGAPNGAKFDDGGACRGSGAQKVGSFRPNRFGLYDVSGNVWEWCSDWYAARAYGSGPATDPAGPSSGSERVLRGGALNSNQKGLRVSLRNHLVPVSRSIYVGLRCAQDGARP